VRIVAFDPGMRHITIRHVTTRSSAAAYVGNTDIDSQYEDVATWTDVTKYYAGLPKTRLLSGEHYADHFTC